MLMLLLVAVVGVLFVWVSTRRKASKKRTQATENASARLPDRATIHVRLELVEEFSRNVPNTLDMGPVVPSPDGAWILNSDSTFPLTLEGITQPTAEEIKKILDEQFSGGTYYAAIDALVAIIARSNVRCREVDEYVTQFRPQYLQEIESLKQSSAEWTPASEKDREDLVSTFRQQAMESLDIRPDCDLETLFECEPTDATFDDALIDRFGYDNFRFYLRYAGNLNKVRVIPAGHYERSGFDNLVTAGLAIRGPDIPLSAILEAFKLKEMAGLVPESTFPAFRKKAQAVGYLMMLPDIKERIGRVRALRELFQLKPLPEEFSKVDLRRISATWKHANEVASLIARTYVQSCYAKQHLGRDQKLLPSITGWGVLSLPRQGSCPYCKRAAAKLYPKHRPPQVPLHIGCCCLVQPKIKIPERGTTPRHVRLEPE